MNRNRQEKGITLIALVVTLVILIILATIAINLVFKDDGIIKRVEKAKDIHENSEKKEQDELKKVENIIEEFEKKIIEMPSTWDKNKVTAINDGKGNPVPIPKGFYYVGGDIDTGIVISDEKEEGVDSFFSKGNQFVWIPVPSIEDFQLLSFPDLTPLKSRSSEPAPYQDEIDMYADLTSSIATYGGFFIGRYMTGTDTQRSSLTEPKSECFVKPGKYFYNYVYHSITKSSGESWESAVDLAKNFYSSPNVISHLTFGAEWDAMLVYTECYKFNFMCNDYVSVTGRDYTKKHVEDFANSYREWTMEWSTGFGPGDTFRYIRKGRAGERYSHPESRHEARPFGFETFTPAKTSFRICLYIP